MDRTELTDSFFELTPERVLAAVEAAGLRCTPVCYPLNSFENRVYEVELEDGSRVVAKFYRPGRWSEEQILEEHRFLRELHDEEIPVCPMRPLPDGGTLARTGGIHYCVADRRAGRAPDELGDAEVVRLGRMVGRIHGVGVRSDAPSRLRLDGDSYGREPLAWLERHEALPRSVADRYRSATLRIAEVADRRLEGIELHRLHGDLHLGNVLFRDGLLRLLDFDDMLVGPAIQDLWLAVPGHDPESRRQRALLLDAYTEFRDLDPAQRQLIEPLRGLRMVHHAAWLARRYRDPAFERAWPEFGSEAWWQRETEDLEQQLERIERERFSTAPAVSTVAATVPAEELLDNRDYFWDWEDR